MKKDIEFKIRDILTTTTTFVNDPLIVGVSIKRSMTSSRRLQKITFSIGWEIWLEEDRCLRRPKMNLKMRSSKRKQFIEIVQICKFEKTASLQITSHYCLGWDQIFYDAIYILKSFTSGDGFSKKDQNMFGIIM